MPKHNNSGARGPRRNARAQDAEKDTTGVQYDAASLKRNSPQPLYTQIKDLVLDMIATIPLQAHDKLESERELGQRFGVNRLTVRKALGELVQEGVLFRQKGKGTYVSPPKITQPLLVIRSFTEIVLQEERQPGARLQEVSLRPGNAHVCRQLQIPADSRVFRLVRLRTVNGVPIAIITSYIPHDLTANLQPEDFESPSLYGLLREKCGHEIVHADVTLEPTVAVHQEASLLEVDASLPMMLMHALVYNQSDRVLEYSRVLYRGDKVRFSVSSREKDEGP